MDIRTHRRAVCALASAAFLALPVAAVAQQSSPTPYQSLGRDLLREMVDTNTEHSIGSTTKLAESIAARFRAAGFAAADVQMVGPDTGSDVKDERISVHAFYDQLEFTYRLLKEL